MIALRLGALAHRAALADPVSVPDEAIASETTWMITRYLAVSEQLGPVNG